jgi:hypothetical protein
MTQTTQLRSRTFINDTGKDSTLNTKPEAEANKRLLLSLYDDLNVLGEEVNRLDNLIRKKDTALSVLKKMIKELI